MEPVSETDTTADEPERGESPTETGENASREPEESSPEVEQIPKDVVFGLLSAKRRRHVLDFLDATDGESTLNELAEHIAGIENGIDPRQLSSQQRKRVYVALYQAHLPKMADAGVIDYDKARGTIELQPEADQLLVYLELEDSETSSKGPVRWIEESVHVGTLRNKIASWFE